MDIKMCIRDSITAALDHNDLRVFIQTADAGGGGGGRNAPKPVSYTHLDVYKRQGLHLSEKA